MPSVFKRGKFQQAFKGVAEAIRIENSFKIHFAAGILAIIISFFLKIDPVEWCLVLLVIGLVLLAEMFNTVIELLVRLHTGKHNDLAKKLLDISAGAVLVSSVVALIVGTVIFGCRIVALLQ